MAHIPPPAVLAGSIVVSYVVARVDSYAHPTTATHALGVALSVAGVATALAGIIEFRRQRTTINPVHPERASSIVRGGVYGWTRNPMYLGLTLVALGAAAWLASPFALVGPLGLFLWLDRVQIPAEERALSAKFGDDYAAFRSSVHRWVGRA